jgi:tetratricopeptide (TPR) repeat protein
MRLGEARNLQGELENALGDYQIALLKFEIWQDTHTHLSRSVIRARDWIKFGIRQGVAQTLFDMRDNRRAREEIDRILTEINQEQLPEQAAEALNLEAGVAYRENDIKKSSQLLEECLAIYQSYGNRDKMAAIYSNLGVLAMATNELDEAKNYLTMGLEINRALGDSAGVAITQNNLGQLEAKRHRHYEASKYLEAAVLTSRRAELNQLLGQSLANLGGVYTALGRATEARNVLEEAEAISKSFDYQDLLSEVGWRQVECYLDLGEVAQALESGEEALSLAIDVKSRDLQSEARRVLSRVYREMGEDEKALKQASGAWKARVTDQDPLIRARFSAEYALALAANQREDEARRIVKDFIAGIKGIEARQISAELGRLDLKTE